LKGGSLVPAYIQGYISHLRGRQGGGTPTSWLGHSPARQNNIEEIEEYEVIKDIGSGLNEDRKGFKKILKLATERKISKIVVA